MNNKRHVNLFCVIVTQNFDEECAAVESFPNATVAEYGTVSGEADIMAEVFARGPVACEIDASPLREYTVRAGWLALSLSLSRRGCGDDGGGVSLPA